MKFNQHILLEGQHAFLGASKYHWVNYDIDKLVNSFNKHHKTVLGTRLHDFASEAIRLKIRMPKTKNTLNMYINDGIGFKMIPEQPLFYSFNAFGTADTISFKDNLLRIHDYKSGETLASMKQLEIYDAYFCLEYKKDPFEIEHELRIYQNDQIFIHKPNPADIQSIMNKTILFDKEIEKIKGVIGL